MYSLPQSYNQTSKCKRCISSNAYKNVNFKISDSTKKFLFAVALTFCVAGVYAQDTSAGTAALTQVTTDIQKYIPIVQKLVYAIAGVVAVIGAVSVYIKMNNEEQDVKKSIMMIIGACIFLVAAATALPAFFGL